MNKDEYAHRIEAWKRVNNALGDIAVAMRFIGNVNDHAALLIIRDSLVQWNNGVFETIKPIKHESTQNAG